MSNAPDQRTDPFRYFIPVTVRFAETDANAHMSHVSIVIYMEQARTDYVFELGLFDAKRIAEEGRTFVLASQAVQYVSQAYFRDQLDVYIRVSRIGRSSLDMEYRIVNRNSRAIVATGTSTQVYYDIRAQKSTPLPADLPARIEAFESRFVQEHPDRFPLA